MIQREENPPKYRPLVQTITVKRRILVYYSPHTCSYTLRTVEMTYRFSDVRLDSICILDSIVFRTRKIPPSKIIQHPLQKQVFYIMGKYTWTFQLLEKTHVESKTHTYLSQTSFMTEVRGFF